jgi:hypothetical protein
MFHALLWPLTLVMMQQQGVVHVHRVHRMKPVCFRCKKNSEQASIPESKGSFRNIFVKNKKNIAVHVFFKNIYTCCPSLGRLGHATH